MQLEIELIAPDRQPARQGLESLEVAAQRAVLLRAGHGLVLPKGQLLEHLGGRTTAVVAHPRKPEGLVNSRRRPPLLPVGLHGLGIAPGSDGCGRQGQQLRSIGTAPAEQAMGKGIAAVPGQLVGAEPTHPAELRHGRQTGGKAKTVGQPAELVGPLGETAAAVGLALLELPQQRWDPHQDAIAFHPGAIDRLKAALLHGRQKAGKQSRMVLLNPGVERRGGVGEVQRWIPLHQGQRRLEGAQRRLPGVRHRPEPGQIQMGMAQHMEPTRGPERSALLQNAGDRLLLQLRQEGCRGLRRQTGHPKGQGIGSEYAAGVVQRRGLLIDPAVDQGAVVVQRGAQAQLQRQGLPLPPGGRQGPAAGAVK